MAAGGLDGAVRSEREHEPAHQRSPEWQPKRTEPERGRGSSADVGEQRERVPRADRSEQRVQRPEEESERPAREVRAFVRLGLEAVRVDPRGAGVRQLVSWEPEVVRRLEVVPRRDDARARLPVGEQLVVRMAKCG